MPKQLNIAALIPYPVFPAKMGGQKGIALFYEYFSDIVPVTLIGTSDNILPEKFKEKFLPALGYSKLRYINPFLIPRLVRIMREREISHLILEHPYFGWLALAVQSLTGVQLVIHSHNIESLRFKSTGKWWWKILWHYEGFLHRKADFNFFITDEDREFAVKHFRLAPAKCYTVTYGFDLSQPPLPAEKATARHRLGLQYKLLADDKLLFFNGTLSYGPNLDAVDVILKEINPRLLAAGIKYKILICGKGLPDSYRELEEFREKNIIYAGFVDDISILFKGADIFINPVTGGGGIKTKLIEALGFNMSVVSTESGAIGVSTEITGDKLSVVKDNDWDAFCKMVVQMNSDENIPPAFFEKFYWENIALQAKRAIS